MQELDEASLGRLEALYRDHYRPSVHLAQLMVGNREEAEELTQDAFVLLLSRIDDLDNPPGYLRTVVVNLCQDRLRRRSMAGRYPQPPQPDAPPPNLPVHTSAVWVALQGLPDRQRIAVSLRYWADRPTDEIAQILGVRPATVRSLIHRGLTALKEVVSDD